ncbi:MAG TPA: SDR family NAD(P)-dependent oxidoreductase [Allosphingosinicella sp.]|nr:SDR family NAD(P)-dependent oxidoreductase [Allosphingosinicella sp.]
MTDLVGKRIIVAGGTGDVGAGIVAVLMGMGADVLVPARDPAKAERLKAESPPGGRLNILLGEPGTVAGAEALAAQITDLGKVDAVVASLGGWWQGSSLLGVQSADWDRIIAGNLTSHFAVARAFLPSLHEHGGSYIQILGGAAQYPIPGSSLVSITAAAVAMMGRVLAAENQATSVKVRQIMIESMVATRARPDAEAGWVKVAEIGMAAARIISAQGGTENIVRLPSGAGSSL